MIVREIVETLQVQQGLTCGVATVTNLTMLMVPGAAQLMEQHMTTPSPHPLGPPPSDHAKHTKREKKSKKHKTKSKTLPRKSKAHAK